MGLNEPQLQALQCQYRELSEQKQVADSVANDFASQLKVNDVVSVLATVCLCSERRIGSTNCVLSAKLSIDHALIWCCCAG